MNKLAWGTWFKGLISATIGGGANSITSMVVAPEVFNTKEGLSNVVAMAVVGAILGAAMYLKQSPIPPVWDGEDRRN